MDWSKPRETHVVAFESLRLSARLKVSTGLIRRLIRRCLNVLGSHSELFFFVSLAFRQFAKTESKLQVPSQTRTLEQPHCPDCQGFQSSAPLRLSVAGWGDCRWSPKTAFLAYSSIAAW